MNFIANVCSTAATGDCMTCELVTYSRVYQPAAVVAKYTNNKANNEQQHLLAYRIVPYLLIIQFEQSTLFDFVYRTRDEIDFSLIEIKSNPIITTKTATFYQQQTISKRMRMRSSSSLRIIRQLYLQSKIYMAKRTEAA